MALIQLGNGKNFVHRAGDGLTPPDNGFTDVPEATNAADTVIGGNSVDVVFAYDGNDKARGNKGSDELNGMDGNDKLFGGRGGDDLDGGAGTDRLLGGSGADTLTGGDDADQFIFTSVRQSKPGHADTITDFDSTEGDVIDLSGIQTDAADGAFFLGGDTFTGAAGELIQNIVGGQTILQGDSDGDGVADIEIKLDGSPTLTVTDFNL